MLSKVSAVAAKSAFDIRILVHIRRQEGREVLHREKLMRFVEGEVDCLNAFAFKEITFFIERADRCAQGHR